VNRKFLLLLIAIFLYGCASLQETRKEVKSEYTCVANRSGGACFAGESKNESSATLSPWDRFAQCLTNKGVKIYGANWCQFTNKERDEFGPAFRYLNYINCDVNSSLCNSTGIKVYPTWEMDGKFYEGFKSISELAAMSRCSF